jgi:hypothetical protein
MRELEMNFVQPDIGTLIRDISPHLPLAAAIHPVREVHLLHPRR